MTELLLRDMMECEGSTVRRLFPELVPRLDASPLLLLLLILCRNGAENHDRGNHQGSTLFLKYKYKGGTGMVWCGYEEDNMHVSLTTVTQFGFPVLKS